MVDPHSFDSLAARAHASRSAAEARDLRLEVSQFQWSKKTFPAWHRKGFGVELSAEEGKDFRIATSFPPESTEVKHVCPERTQWHFPGWFPLGPL
jgi:hypothetical protein